MSKRTGHRGAALLISLLILVSLPTSETQAQSQVADRFRDYFRRHDGMRVLGSPLTGLVVTDDYPAQYFEKGRLEDHRADGGGAAWQFLYGRLTAELMARAPDLAVNATNMRYADLRRAAAPDRRHRPPPGFTSGTQAEATGVFVPYDPQLGAAPGFVVPLYFWSYINRPELFPGGWLHDVGLPMTDAYLVETTKRGRPRQVMLQAFERTVLTYDPRNPPAWQVERGNIGTDALAAGPIRDEIAIPAPGARVTLPLHIQAHAGRPGEQITVALRWRDGVELRRSFTTLRGRDGSGLLIANLGWQTESPPPHPSTRMATLELHDRHGVLLARRDVEVLPAGVPETQAATIFWVVGDRLRPQVRYLPRTPRVGAATLDALLWGPLPGNMPGYSTAIPRPEEVLNFAGRDAGWGPRVTLRKLSISNGVATADFSRELRAYGGGALRARLIRDQITRTLQQFPTVRTVQITIEGRIEGVLAP